MRSLLAIARREIASYFLSPIAYVAIAVFLAISGYFFSIVLIATRIPDMRGVFGNIAVTFLFVAPVLTMRSLAEERKLGTEELLFTSPVPITSIVLGKFAAACAIYLVMLALTLVYPAILLLLGNPDLGPIFTGYLGLLLLGTSFIAIGILASSLTESQVIAGVIAFGLLLGFWVIGWLGESLGGPLAQITESLSLLAHFDDFEQGLLDTSHLFFYLSFIAGALFLAIQRLDARRWS